MFWQRMRAGSGFWAVTEDEIGGDLGAVTEGEIGGDLGAVTEDEIGALRLGFPTQPLLQPVSGFSGFLALDSTMSVIFYSPGCTTETL